MERVKVTERALKDIIKRSVRKVLKEEYGLGSVGDKVAWDARQDASWEAAERALQQNPPHTNECKQLISYFNSAMQILNKMDPSEYGNHSDEVDWFFHDIYDFLEEYAIRIKNFANGDLSEQNLSSDKYSKS